MFGVCGEMEIVKQRPSWRKQDVVNIEDCEYGQQFNKFELALHPCSSP